MNAWVHTGMKPAQAEPDFRLTENLLNSGPQGFFLSPDYYENAVYGYLGSMECSIFTVTSGHIVAFMCFASVMLV